MSTNPSEFKHGPDYPAENVSWHQAKEFCRRATELMRSSGPAWPEQLVFRLPTDEEWSLAAGLSEESGGTPVEKDGRLKDVYPWGAQWPPPREAGNYCDQAFGEAHPGWAVVEDYADGYADTAPVGSFRANQYGLYDLGGNVWEWCEDWYDPATKISRVLRGGSWANHEPENLLTSARNYYPPTYRYGNIGFRVTLGRPIP
jgi:formylglycine-generating enzyme required for sulfatase activity